MESLLQAHHPFLVRLASSLVRDTHLADDLVQEVSKRVLSAGPDAEEIERPRSFFARILRHEVARQHGRRRSVPGHEAVSTLAARGVVDPEALALRAEREQVVSEELYRLNPADRDVLFLRFYEDLSVDRIAEALGLTRTAAQSRLTRAKARLAERLEARLGAADSENGGWQRALLPLVTGVTGTRASVARASLGSSVQAAAWWPWIAVAAATLAAFFVGAWLLLARGPESIAPLDPVAVASAQLEPAAPAASGEAVALAPAPIPVEPEPPTVAAAQLARSVVYAARDREGHPLLGEPVTIAAIDTSTGAIGQEIRSATDVSGRFQYEGMSDLPFLVRSSREFYSHQVADLATAGPHQSTGSRIEASAFPVRIRLAPETSISPETVCSLWAIGSTVGAELPAPCESFDAAAGLLGHAMHDRRFRVTAPGFAPSETLKLEGSTPRDNEGVRELVFRLEPCAGSPLTGHVLGRESVTSDPTALANAAVILESADEPRRTWDAPHVLLTDAEGRFMSSFDLPFGALRVEVHATGHGIHRGTIQHGPTGEPIVLQLEPERVLRGRVLHGDTPVEEATVQAMLEGETFPTSWGGLEGAMGPRPYAWTDTDGRFEIRGLPSERVALFAEGPSAGPSRNATARLEIPPSGAPGEEIVLTIGAAPLVQGRVLGPEGAPLLDIRVEARSASAGSQLAGWAETDESGAFAIRPFPGGEPIAPGESLRLTAILETTLMPSYDRFSTHLGTLETTVGALDADFQITELPVINASARGRVVIPENLAESLTMEELELHFQATSMYTGIDHRSMNAPTGDFEFGPIPAGVYDLSIVRERDHSTIWARSGITLEDGAELDFGELVIGSAEGAGQVEILVQDEAGTRLDEAAVGEHAVRVRMSDRMMNVLLHDSGDAWRPEFPMAQGTWFTELWSKTYRATRAEFEIREGERARVTLTATRR